MIAVAWLIASLIFFCFSLIFWRFGNEPIRAFAIRRRFKTEEVEIGEPESKKLSSEFLSDFEGYLKTINELNKFRYRIAAGGFLTAGLAAILLALTLS